MRRKTNPTFYVNLADLLSSYQDPDTELYGWEKIPDSEVAYSGGASSLLPGFAGDRYLVSMYPMKFTEVRNSLATSEATEVRSPVEAAYVAWKILEAGQPNWTGFVVDLKDGKSWSHPYFYPHFEWNLRERGQGDYVLEKYLPRELPSAADLKAWRAYRAGGWKIDPQIRDVLAQYETPENAIHGWQKLGRSETGFNVMAWPAGSQSDPRWHVFVAPSSYGTDEAGGPVDAHHGMMDLLTDGGWTVFVYDAFNDVFWTFETWGPEFEEHLELKSGGRVLDAGLLSRDPLSEWIRAL